MSIPYEPETTTGRGLMRQLVSGMTHAMLVLHAKWHEWPLTNAQAKAELEDGLWTDMERARLYTNILTQPSQDAFNMVWTEYEELRVLVSNHASLNPDAPLPDLEPMATNVVRQMLALCSILDTELTGITNADPGTTP